MVEGKRQGEGVEYDGIGLVKYSGEWKEDEYSGEGTVYNEIAGEYITEVNFADLDEIKDGWTKYTGSFQKGQKSGKGTLILNNSDRIQGTWNQNLFNGLGSYLMNTGVQLQAIWKTNKLVQMKFKGTLV